VGLAAVDGAFEAAASMARHGGPARQITSPQ
jgi:hypothetical protein